MGKIQVANIPFKISEKDIAKIFISLNEDIRKIIIDDKKLNLPASVFKIIIKYLLTFHKENPKDSNYSLYNILKFIKIYSILYCSVILYKDKQTNPFYKFYENNNLTVDNFLAKTSNEIKNPNDSLVNIFNQILKNERITEIDSNDLEDIKSILTNNINYFNINNLLNNYFKNENRNSFDKMICEYNYSHLHLHEFTVEIDKDNYNAFSENVINKENEGKRTLDSYLLISILIDSILNSNNLDLNKPITVEPGLYYKFLTNRISENKMSFSDLMFLKKISSNKYKFIKENINTFRFKWIDKDEEKTLYEFSSEGIKKVKNLQNNDFHLDNKKNLFFKK